MRAGRKVAAVNINESQAALALQQQQQLAPKKAPFQQEDLSSKKPAAFENSGSDTEESLASSSSANVAGVPSSAAARSSSTSSSNNSNNSPSSPSPSPRMIQQWHAVLGDTSCREDRTTQATKLLRQVKKKFQKVRKGDPPLEWIPDAIQEYDRSMVAAFGDGGGDNGSDGAAGGVPASDFLILLKVNSKTKDRLEEASNDDNIVTSFAYAGDPKKAQYGLAKRDKALEHFFLSRDSPTLPREISRHRENLEKLRQRPERPPLEMIGDFEELLQLFERRIRKANQGDVLSQEALNSFKPINTLKRLWKVLEKHKKKIAPEETGQEEAKSNDENQAGAAIALMTNAGQDKPASEAHEANQNEEIITIASDTKVIQREDPNDPFGPLNTVDIEFENDVSILEFLQTLLDEDDKGEPSDSSHSSVANFLRHLEVDHKVTLEESEFYLKDVMRDDDSSSPIDNESFDPSIFDPTTENRRDPELGTNPTTSVLGRRPREDEGDDTGDESPATRVASKRLCVFGFPALAAATVVAALLYTPLGLGRQKDAGDSVGRSFNKTKFLDLVNKMESDVVDFALKIEGLYSSRCSQTKQCGANHYDECQSALPHPECLGGTSFQVTCDNEKGFCSALYDFSVSSVRIPGAVADGQSRNPTSPDVIETICYTESIDDWLQSKRTEDKPFWEEYGVEPRAWHFGSRTGAFRIWPARQSENCGEYDPRLRPWYVEASSGPKNVVLVLDTSRSMAGLRMILLREAAKRVVSTLTESDRIAIVAFDSEASLITDFAEERMLIASEANKETILGKIDELEAKGLTNFFNGFNKAFDVLDESARDYHVVNCNTAVIFLTDGEMTEDDLLAADTVQEKQEKTEDEVLRLVDHRLRVSNQLLSQPAFLFTYSISADDNLHDLPSKLACSSERGVWSQISTDGDIVRSLSSYYYMFALGLGIGENKDFVSWVQPYEYDPGEALGTSVSVPVYDRSKNPPLFLGVATIDISMSALNVASGINNDEGGKEAIHRLATKSKAKCPRVDLSICQLESIRRQSAEKIKALCSSTCSSIDLDEFEELRCQESDEDYPTQLWANMDNVGLDYSERTLCDSGGNRALSTELALAS